MNSRYNLELTFIPSQYRNEKYSGFELIDKKEALPKNVDFFLLWSRNDSSEQFLIENIKNVFPNIPVNRLRTCKIKLSFPSNKDFFEIANISGKILPLIPSLKVLLHLQIMAQLDRNLPQYSNSIITFAFLTKFAFELINKGNFAPTLDPLNEKKYLGRWRILIKTQEDHDRFKVILENCPWTVYNLPASFIQNRKKKIPSTDYITNVLWHPSYLISYFLDTAGDLIIKSILNSEEFQAFRQFYSTELKKENDPEYKLPWDYKFLKSLIFTDSIFQIGSFHESVIPTVIKNWSQISQDFTIRYGISLLLELNYPKNIRENWPLKLSIIVENNIKIPLANCFDEVAEIEKKIQSYSEFKQQFREIVLRFLGIASKIYPPINRAIQSGIQNEILLESQEVIEFLKYPKDLLIQNGFNVILPEIFTKGGKNRLTARLIVRSKGGKKATGKSSVLPSVFTKTSLLEFKWEAILKGTVLTDDEFKELIETPESLKNWRGEWVLIDQEDLTDLRNLYVKEQELNEKGFIEALKLGLTEKIQFHENKTKYDVILEGDIGELIEKIKSIDHFEPIPIPKEFKGNLRPYQQKGLIWMGNMCKLNFGLCLADDMGLGKTIQVIALLLYFKEKYPTEPGSVLIICPMSLLFNWLREIKKFAPDIDVILHHGPDRFKEPEFFSEFLHPHRIFLTSYGTIRNDIDFLETIPFSGIIVDESQNIKNYHTQQTQAIYKLQANYRICLSGTPIENRLMELWTLFEFLNPGLLGSRTDFQKTFIYPIEKFQDQGVIDKLKKIISPFILRRVKSDKTIISELPDKIEAKIFITLSDVQRKLYKELVDDTLLNLENIITNKMNILNLLVKLKQICNHPFQYLKKSIPDFKNDAERESFISQSQKLERLIEMIDEVILNGEKALIFTQFTQMGDIIYNLLQKKYNFNILYFHGKLQEKKRKELVDEFQSEGILSSPIMILSLKAGGTGLNLTKGTTVVHFDRWYNPSVEAQATDRAYRIGQTKQVNVYKFVTVGTIEEKIDALLEEKMELAQNILTSSGETWISDLNLEDFKNLFSFTK